MRRLCAAFVLQGGYACRRGHKAATAGLKISGFRRGLSRQIVLRPDQYKRATGWSCGTSAEVCLPDNEADSFRSAQHSTATASFPIFRSHREVCTMTEKAGSGTTRGCMDQCSAQAVKTVCTARNGRDCSSFVSSDIPSALPPKCKKQRNVGSDSGKFCSREAPE